MLSACGLALICSIIFLHVLPGLCRDAPFNGASNWGGTGILEVPSARILEDGVIRFGYAQALPYRWYVAGMGVLPRFEVSGRVTEITNIESGLGEDYGSNKDKALDLKFQIVSESRRWPAMAVGLQDIVGTKLLEAQYLAVSRQIFPFDFTVGLGRQRLGGGPESPLSDELGLFGAVECAIHDHLHLMAEYNPIEYEHDSPSVRGVPEGARWPVNFGVRVKLLPGLDLGASYQRGDTFGFMAHLQSPLGDPIIPKRPDPPKWVSADRRPFAERDATEMVHALHRAVRAAGFDDVLVYASGRDLTAEFENTKYLSNPKAAGRVLRILLFHSPSDTRRLHAVLKKRKIPLLRVSVAPDHLERFLFGKIPQEIFERLVEIQEGFSPSEGESGTAAVSRDQTSLAYQTGIKPEVQLWLNDPSGVVKGRVGIKPWVTANLWEGAAGYARYDIPFYSNIESSNVPVPEAVRSDAWIYLDRNYSFDRLLLDQAVRLYRSTYGRMTFGYLDKMYAGAGGEVLTFLLDGVMALGLEADYAIKREPDTQFQLLDFRRHTVLGNAYFRVPWIDMTLRGQYGRFLAGDVGWKLTASRRYANGVEIGAWYTDTDTDELTGYNQGYHDKGVLLTLPVNMFVDHESNVKYQYAIAPWTRDVGATVFHWEEIFSLVSDLTARPFRENLRQISD
jgi:hypothetical protein